MIQELENFCWEEIESIEEVGEGDCYDICILEDDVYLDEPNYVAGGFLVHNSGMHDEYCDRKNGKKEYEIHPLLKSILSKTYGVICYQEQCIRILNIVGDIPLKDCETVRKAISKKKKEKFDKYQKQFIEVGTQKLGDRRLAEEIWDLLCAFSEYAFNLSHAVAYTYISLRQLWQKAHYPLEFYAASLKSLDVGDERIIDYIQDARKHNISVKPIDINKSKLDFSIIDDEIYYGFSKVKGIGGAAEDIVKGQPYKDFQDFIDRGDTEAKVIQPLISLGVFKEADPMTLYLYCETYKNETKKKQDCRKRFEKTSGEYLANLTNLIPDWSYGFDDAHFGKLRGKVDAEKWGELCKLKKKYDKCVDTFSGKDLSVDLSLANFDPKNTSVKGEKLDKMKPLLEDEIKAQVEFYGFPWINDFERCPNYRGFTFEEYEIDIQRAEEGAALPVEVRIETVDHVTSRTGKMQYWKLKVTDASEPFPRSVTVWEHDYERFESILQPGNIVRMRLFPPQSPYPNYSLEGCKPWEMRGRNRYGENPDFDVRVVLLKKAVRKEKK